MDTSSSATSAMMGPHFTGSGKARRRRKPASPAPRFRPPASGDSEGGGRKWPPPGVSPAPTDAPAAARTSTGD
eukprot:15450758-Alexandrium_andersonii.AAC.1